MRTFRLICFCLVVVTACPSLAADEVATTNSPPPSAVTLDATVIADVTSGYLLYGALMNSQPCAQGGVEAGASYRNLEIGRASCRERVWLLV